MQTLAIIIISVLAAITYGIIHDQITARICIEYFTIGHAQLIGSDSPTVLGLFWGVVATWWAGIPLGTGLAIAARAGSRPKLTYIQLIRPISVLLVGMFGVAILAGFIGYYTSKAGIFYLIGHLALLVPTEKQVAFLTVGWAHSGSYLAGFSGAVILWVVIWRRRGKNTKGE